MNNRKGIERKRKSILGRNSGLRKVKKKRNINKSIHFNVDNQMQHITNYLVIKNYNDQNDDEKVEEQAQQYGDTFTRKSDGTTRIWFTNPCGIGVNPHEIKSHDSFNFLRKKSKADIFGLAETNVNWFKLHGAATFSLEYIKHGGILKR